MPKVPEVKYLINLLTDENYSKVTCMDVYNLCTNFVSIFIPTKYNIVTSNEQHTHILCLNNF